MAGNGSLVELANWYRIVLANVMGAPEKANYWWPILATAFVTILLALIGSLAGFHKLQVDKLTNEEILPQGKISLRSVIELVWQIIEGSLKSVIGENWYIFAPFLGGTFLFIILSNLLGLIPGFTPVTEQMNMTFSIGICSFIYFNFVGIKYSGYSYIKHLFGPIVLLAPLMFVIEIISLFARPVSLGLRLFGNISGDHLVYSVFATLVRDFHIPFLPIPAAMLGFGMLVACLQAFIFVTLSAVYVKLSLDAGHGHQH